MKKYLVALILVLALAVLFSGALLQAQTGDGYDLSWFTIDGGGGTSSSASYTLSGTVGQPDAGTLEGDDYKLVGGFWGGSTIQYDVYLPVNVRQ